MSASDRLRRKLLATGRYIVVKGWGIYPKDMSHRLEEEGR